MTDPAEHERISIVLTERFQALPCWPVVQRNKEGIVSTGRGIMSFFPVNNTDRDSLERFMECLEDTAVITLPPPSIFLFCVEHHHQEPPVHCSQLPLSQENELPHIKQKCRVPFEW